MSNDDGSPIDPDIVSRKALMKYMCMKIPMLQIRKERLAMQKAAQVRGIVCCAVVVACPGRVLVVAIARCVRACVNVKGTFVLFTCARHMRG